MSGKRLLTHLTKALQRKGGPANGQSSVTQEEIRELEGRKRRKFAEFVRQLEEARRKRKSA